MEKVRFYNSRGGELVGVYYPADSDHAIVISHGFLAHKERPRLVALAKELHDAGFAVLRFDFSGCGESAEDSITIEKEVNDLACAMSFVREKKHSSIGLVGQSLGGLVSLKAFEDSVGAIVLWGPITHSLEHPILRNEHKKKELDALGFFLKEKEGRTYKVEKQYIEERLLLDQKQLTSSVSCPVLILHGGADRTIPLGHSQQAIQFLSKESQLTVLEGATHALEECMQKAILLSQKWFSQHLKKM